MSRRVAICLVAAAVSAAGGARASAAPPTTFPAHVYAPYFETWTTDGITPIAQASGARWIVSV